MPIETHDETVKSPDGGMAPVYVTPPRTVLPTTQPDATTAEVITGGASVEAIGGGGAIVLAIIGLTGYLPFYMTAIATIAAGGALLVHGVAVAARWRQTIERFRSERDEEVIVGGGVGTETLGGAGGVVLGILALANVLPMVLLPVAAIVLGVSLLLAGPAQPELAGFRSSFDRRYENAVRATVQSAGGVDILVGAGAGVLGILALLHIGPPLIMTMVAMLAVGCGLVASGGAMAARFGRHIQHA